MAENRKPFAIKQAEFEVKEAEKTLAQLKKENGSPTAIREAEEALREARKQLRALTSGSGEERREARRDYMAEYYDELGGAWVAALVKQDPELRKLIEQAIRKGWDETEFLKELYQTDWWTNPKRSASWKQAFQQEYAADKTTWQKSIEDAKRDIQSAADRMGVDISGMDLDVLARRYMYQGWGENEGYGLRQWIATQARKNIDPNDPDSGWNPGGDAATGIEGLRQRARAYGLTYSDAWFQRMIARIADPSKNFTMDDVVNQMVADARSKYPVYADRLTSDYTMRDAAGGYLGTMAQLLELSDPDEIELDDPLLQQAWTSVVDDKGQAGVMSLWDFQKLVRQDQRWQYTENAHTTYTKTAEDVLKMFGFRG